MTVLTTTQADPLAKQEDEEGLEERNGPGSAYAICIVIQLTHGTARSDPIHRAYETGDTLPEHGEDRQTYHRWPRLCNCMEFCVSAGVQKGTAPSC